MKNVIVSAVLISLLVMPACSVTQEMKDGVSFKGLKTFYVDPPGCTWQLFSSPSEQASADMALRDAIVEFLTSRGYEKVDERAKAQIIFRPLWNVSQTGENEDAHFPAAGNKINTIGFGAGNAYATLEIQAILPDDNLWAWRGFSPVQIAAKYFTKGTVGDQVKWCLEYFPPDKYPSRLEEIKRERSLKLKREQNPFSEVPVEERRETEKEAKQAGK